MVKKTGKDTFNLNKWELPVDEIKKTRLRRVLSCKDRYLQQRLSYGNGLY